MFKKEAYNTFLHWFPVKYFISYIIILLALKTLNGLALSYITELYSHTVQLHPQIKAANNPTVSLKTFRDGQ